MTSLPQISKGLQLHEDLLSIIVNHLEQKQQLSDLKIDITNLKKQIIRVGACVCVRSQFFISDSKVNACISPLVPLQMLKVAGGQVEELPKPTLNLPGNYEVQVAAHLTLQQLQNFLQDVDQCLEPGPEQLTDD